MHYEWIDCDVQDGVARISLLGPSGALATDFCDEFLDLLLRLQEDRAARVLLLTDTGGDLDMSFDRRGLAERWARGEGPEQMAGDLDVIRRVTMLMQDFTKPLIAAVTGDVRDGGFGFVMNFDIRLVAPTATFTAPDMVQGTLPDWGLSYLLPRRIGSGRTFDILWSGRSVGGPEAHAMGLVDRLFESDTFEEDVEAFVARLVDIPQPTMQLSRMTVQQSSQFDQTTALSLEYESQEQCWDSRETAEAMAAWSEGRRPEYWVADNDDE